MAVVKWEFFDPVTLDEYTFEINPNEGGVPTHEKNIEYQATAAFDGKTIIFEGRDRVQTLEFSGTILTEAQYLAMIEWFGKRNQIKVTDHLGEERWIYITKFQPTRQRAIHYPHKYTYTVAATILDWPEDALRTGSALIWDLWSRGGPFIGTDATHAVVTVEPEWYLSTNVDSAGKWPTNKLPIRWWQAEANDQVEVEIPNIAVIDIDRSIEQDAGTCTITLQNQWMKANLAGGPAGELGQPGYFTWDRGASADATARWGHVSTAWRDILIPNALLRTYQGFGGKGKELADARADGNLMLTGVWLIDEIRVGTNGRLEIKARDVAKLLIDQDLYPPLVPSSFPYPLQYCRWLYTSTAVSSAPQTRTIDAGGTVTVGDKRTVYRDSAVDRWYGANYTLHGHRGTDSIDGNLDTFALSVGNSGPDKPFATDWWEYDCGEQMNAIYLHPWMGGYTLYVSVMEDGRWQGDQVVPYDHTPLIGNQPHVVNTGANIPFVAQYGVGWEVGQEFVLPRAYNAQRVRISFRNHTRSQWGPWYYRCGVREFRIRGSAGTATNAVSTVVQPIFYAAASLLDQTDFNRTGYITASIFWQIDAFGDLRVQPFSGGDAQCSHEVASITLTPKGDGYWVMCDHGHIRAYGTAQFHGSPSSERTQIYDDMLIQFGFLFKAGTVIATHTGLGYWVIGWEGIIYSYGDAPTYSAATASPGEFFHGAAAGHPNDYGLWLLDTAGEVTVRGAATHFGNWNESVLTNEGQEDARSEIAIDIAPNRDATGYWILSTGGRVDNFGACTDFGQAAQPSESHSSYDRFYHLLPAPSNLGYLITDGDGNIYPFGEVEHFGAPVPGTAAVLRSDGNYKDYTDIVRDLLLWSGWFLYGDTPLGDDPAVYGNLETTGVFSPTCLDVSMFDKRPPIDPINTIKEIVGYLFWIDDEGAARFESPNWWSSGNFYETGEHVDFQPEIDERHNMTAYQVGFADRNERSEIIITTEEPTQALDTTVTTRFRPNSSLLRGMVRHMMLPVPTNVTPDEQRVMAELIALHLWFARRQGQVQCVANPAIGINDQVRIYERITAETYVHYVRGVTTHHDLESGEYTMTLTTHWLGDQARWAITADDIPAGTEGFDRFVISDKLQAWLQARAQARAQERFRLGAAPAPVAIPIDLDAAPVDEGSAT